MIEAAVLERIEAAIEWSLEDPREAGLKVPEPISSRELVAMG